MNDVNDKIQLKSKKKARQDIIYVIRIKADYIKNFA